MILATLRMTLFPQKRAEITKSLKAMLRESRIQPGCLSSRLYHDEDEEDVLSCEQLWNSQDELDRYLRSDDYRRLLILSESADEPPEIKFQTISETAGMEVIEKARGACDAGK